MLFPTSIKTSNDLHVLSFQQNLPLVVVVDEWADWVSQLEWCSFMNNTLPAAASLIPWKFPALSELQHSHVFCALCRLLIHFTNQATHIHTPAPAVWVFKMLVVSMALLSFPLCPLVPHRVAFFFFVMFCFLLNMVEGDQAPPSCVTPWFNCLLCVFLFGERMFKAGWEFCLGQKQWTVLGFHIECLHVFV